MSSGRQIKKPVSEEDIRAWERGWSEMMVTIWRENIQRLNIVDTGRLYNSFSQRVTDTGGQIQIAHEFMMYGIFVARGVGKGYRHGNSGKDDENGLQFLGKAYRKEHKLGKARQRRDWFTPRYLSSIEVLTRVETELYGSAYMGTLSNVVGAMFGNVSVKGSKGTVLTPALSNM